MDSLAGAAWPDLRIPAIPFALCVKLTIHSETPFMIGDDATAKLGVDCFL